MYRPPVLLAAAMLAGCGGDAPERALAPDTAAGIYLLDSIGGKALPAILVNENGYTLTVMKGAYSLTSSGTYESSLTIRESIQTPTAPSVVTYEEKGSGVYSVSAQFVRFTDALGPEVTAQISGAALTFATDPARVYRK